MELTSLESINNFFIHNPIITVSIGVSALVATVVYTLGFGSMVKRWLQRSRMKQRIQNLKDHYILCGFGRVGQQVASELAEEKEPFVIIERDEAKLKLAATHDWLTIPGDVALDESLFEQAKIMHAKAIVIAVGSDADAVFMAVSARALRKDIYIVARASSIEAADKLYKIGINRVALPYQIGGYHMATMALRPTVVDFLDLLVDQKRDELEMEEFIIKANGSFDNKMIKDFGDISQLAFVAIRHANGKAVINPGDAQKLSGGDRLVVMGPDKALKSLLKEVEKQQGKSDTSLADAPPMSLANQAHQFMPEEKKA